MNLWESIHERLHPGGPRSPAPPAPPGWPDAEVLFPSGKKVPYKDDGRVKDYLVSEVVCALEVSRQDMLANCLGIKL